jgi:hypothetical protein
MLSLLGLAGGKHQHCHISFMSDVRSTSVSRAFTVEVETCRPSEDAYLAFRITGRRSSLRLVLREPGS